MITRILLTTLIILVNFRLMAQENPDQYYDVSAELMSDRLQCIEKDIPLNFNVKVQSFIDYFTIRDREYTKSVISNQDKFFSIFEKILAEEGMPDELKYLSVVESGLRPNAMSRVGAAGLWQFMPATGKYYGLKQSWYIDERMNPWEATRAACKYLKSLYRMFGDWELALAAYNAGPGNVRKAIRRAGYKRSFWEIYRYLPRETRSYLPQFVAIIYTLSYIDEHNFDKNEIDISYQIAFDTIHVDHYMHMETFANQINFCIDDLIALNPQIIRGAMPEGTRNYPLKVPEDKLEFILAHKKELLDSANKVGKKELEYLSRNSPGSTFGRTRTVYKVRGGDVLGTIAQRYHVRISDLKKWNRLNNNMIRIGQRLSIWTLPYYSSKTKEKYVLQNQPPKTQAKTIQKYKPIVGGKYHLVRSGESLWAISRLYKNVSIEKIKELNNLTTSNIKPGQKLLINM